MPAVRIPWGSQFEPKNSQTTFSTSSKCMIVFPWRKRAIKQRVVSMVLSRQNRVRDRLDSRTKLVFLLFGVVSCLSLSCWRKIYFLFNKLKSLCSCSKWISENIIWYELIDYDTFLMPNYSEHVNCSELFFVFQKQLPTHDCFSPDKFWQ